MSSIPTVDKQSWERFTFLANWHVDKFEEIPSVGFSGHQIDEGSYEHLELLEKAFKEKKSIDDFEPDYPEDRLY